MGVAEGRGRLEEGVVLRDGQYGCRVVREERLVNEEA